MKNERKAGSEGKIHKMRAYTLIIPCFSIENITENWPSPNLRANTYSRKKKHSSIRFHVKLKLHLHFRFQLVPTFSTELGVAVHGAIRLFVGRDDLELNDRNAEHDRPEHVRQHL